MPGSPVVLCGTWPRGLCGHYMEQALASGPLYVDNGLGDVLSLSVWSCRPLCRACAGHLASTMLTNAAVQWLQAACMPRLLQSTQLVVLACG